MSQLLLTMHSDSALPSESDRK